MKSKILKITLGLCLLIGAGYAAELLFARSVPPTTTAKSPIIGKVPLYGSGKTLTQYCGRTEAFLFKGYFAFDPANSGTANVLTATIPGASNVTASAGAAASWSAVNSDLIIITGVATDYINIVGEDVETVKESGTITGMY